MLVAWLQEGRVAGYTGHDIVPFEMSAVRVLRGRRGAGQCVGKLLPDGSKVLDAARVSARR